IHLLQSLCLRTEHPGLRGDRHRGGRRHRADHLHPVEPDRVGWIREHLGDPDRPRRGRAVGRHALPGHPEEADVSTAPKYTPDRLDARPVKPSKVRYTLGMLLFGIIFIGATAASGAQWRALLDIPQAMASYVAQMAQG